MPETIQLPRKTLEENGFQPLSYHYMCLESHYRKPLLFTYDALKQSENALNILGGKIENVDKFVLPDTDMGRTLVKISKIRNTPGKYPRKAGIPAKEPL